TRADGIAYPDTPPGRHAREFFPAYNADEAAMSAFWGAHASKPALVERPVAFRLGVWRNMREDVGRLTPLAIRSAGDDAIEVLVHPEHGADFGLQLLCDTD